MNSDLHLCELSEEQLLKECDVRRTRGSGPGGQHRNKVETAIVITHRETGVTGQASERRSQHANRVIAIERLRINLAIETRGPIDSQRQPSQLWMGRIKAGKVVVSSSHFDFATLLAEALDFIHMEGFDVASAARRLGISTSQVVKFLKRESSAFQFVNQERETRDLHRLK